MKQFRIPWTHFRPFNGKENIRRWPFQLRYLCDRETAMGKKAASSIVTSRSRGQVSKRRTAICFLYASGANKCFYILNGWKIAAEKYFVLCEKSQKIQISMFINKVVLTHSHICSLYIDYGHLFATRADWVMWQQPGLQSQKYLLSGTLREKNANPSLKETKIFCNGSISAYMA